ncbi:G kinase-anchoring protein 1-like isoform X1 [Branchiostoma floridae]|uniref:G kinase-anchoring protein 1-like isoform X1 n=1 Tax=Branchiostoma floridae TaxID=7739 RepID=A0A9J7KM07_BRAFL|nr:G kinase-anchoring protein 1-like isoform X1 [Branchiostoma floridae]
MAKPQVSRFACLKIEDDEDDTGEEVTRSTSQNNRQATGAKSKKGKKKKKQGDSTVTNENQASVYKECPICMEVLDRDGRRFFPCPCRYQVCGFCWHRILNEGDSRCPSCRRVYARSPRKPDPQLRNLAFGLKSGAKPKPAPAAATAPAQVPPPVGSGDTTTHSPNVTAIPIGGGTHVSSASTRNGETVHQWEEWKQKDAQFTDHTFEDDLQKAIMMSKLEYEQQRLFYDDPALKAALEEDKGPNRKERRKHLQGKDKPVTMSLDQFQAVADAEEDLKTVVPQRTEPELKEHKSKKKKSPAAEQNGTKFFDQVEQDAKKLLNIERRKEELRTASKANDHVKGGAGFRVAEMQAELEAKELEMAELKEEMAKLKSDHSQVKKRNKQLLVILAQGEMKDKAEVLQQVDELGQIRDELTQEVAELHAALEQERSKVSSLKAELLKYQKHGK